MTSTTYPTEFAADEASFHRFHTDDLPRRLAEGNGALAFEDLESLGTLALKTPAGSYTYVPTGGTVEVHEGTDGADTVVSLDLDSWLGLISDLDTAPGLFYGERVEVPVGKPLRFVRWEPGLRAMFHGLPVFDPDTANLRDLDGAELDVSRRFTLSQLDDPSGMAEARHFLATAGFIVFTAVFDDKEVAELRRGAERAESEAEPADDASWWGRTSDGTAVLTRVLSAAAQPELAGLPHDDRLLRIVETANEPLVAKGVGKRDSVTALWKRRDVVEGLSDLPWHRDCGMGGHATNCPMTVMTICLTDGGPGSGELRVMPGSHEGSFPFVDGRDTRAPEGTAVKVTAGDVSLHITDVMHASMEPTDDLLDGEPAPERISLLLGFVRGSHANHLGKSHYNDVLLGNDGGQVDHLGDRLAR